MIGIIGAMSEEIKPILEKMSNLTETSIHFRPCYKGTISGKEVVVVLAGIGKVNAAITTTLLIEHYQPSAIINIGVAGGQHGVTHNDLVIGEYTVYHDVDVTKFGNPHGKIPNMPHQFFADKTLLNHTIEIVKTLDIDYQVGGIASGDQFVYSSELLKPINKELDNVYAIEMEACAIAHTANLYHIPCIILRSISDVIDDPAQEQDFDAFLHTASQRSASILLALIKRL